MNVLLVTERLGLGGAETFLASLAGALAAQEGLRVSVCAADGEVRRRLDPRVRFLPLPVFSPARAAACFLELRSVVRRLRPDVVHAHGLTVGTLAVAAGGAPAVLTHHNRQAMRLPDGVALRIMDAAFERVIAVSRTKEEGLVAGGLAASKVLHIPNFIDCDLVQARLARADRAGLGLEPGQKVILTAGRLLKGKGFELFIEAVSRLPDAVGLILGEGPERGRLEELARGKPVRLLGYQEDVYRFLAVADVFLFPSEAELLPMALLEAQAAGVPAVCSDIPGNDEIVIHGRTGFLVSGGVDEYCARLEEALRRRSELSREAAQAARRRFDKAGAVSRHAQLYRSLCAA